ncbi:MAG: Holliday junction branch migration DNA helicase RuvB [Candidatus Gracilibacteria bacterium]|nr:Holliday junction branch migration DNA helicase RuvB [Candidatus Gracilibacteria bacterium]
MAIQSSNQNTNPTPITSSTAKEADIFENTLRPKALDEYIGQSRLKENLKVFLAAAKKRNEPLEHTLLYGPPGLGKTTMASIIAHEMGGKLKVTSAPAIQKQGDLAAVLSNLKPGDVLFIDEIHRMSSSVEEILYSAMEDYVLDIMIGKGPSARTMRLNIPQFTLIGATTKFAMLSSPLRDRFGHIFKLEFYSESEISQIIHRSARILEYQVTEEACKKLAKCARRTPRVANRLLKRVRDFADIDENTHNIIDLEITKKTMSALGIDELGLNRTDIDLLKTLIEKFKGGPVGLNTLSAATGEDSGTIEDVYEPFLIQLGMLDRSPRGRIATENAYQHLGLDISDLKKKQEALF